MNTQSVFTRIRDILLHEIEGVDDTRVNLYNQKFIIPTDEKLFITIMPLPGAILRSTSQMVEGESGTPVEVQDLNTVERVIISMYSRNLDALNRREEIFMALGSIYSQQIQEKYSLQIARIGQIVDLSALEGAAQLYRYDVTVTVLAWRQKQKAADFFEHFETEVLGATAPGAHP